MTARGTSNTNARGSAATRRIRRKWLLDRFRADVDVDGEPACRCYRCGTLLTLATLTIDRIHAGVYGGRYDRENIRPACAPCNSSQGTRIRLERKNA